MAVETVAPVLRSVTVECTPEHAFRVFTERLGEWWPLETHSIYGGDVDDAFFEPGEGGADRRALEGGRGVELGRDPRLGAAQPGRRSPGTRAARRTSRAPRSSSASSPSARRPVWSSSTEAGRLSPSPRRRAAATSKAGRACSPATPLRQPPDRRCGKTEGRSGARPDSQAGAGRKDRVQNECCDRAPRRHPPGRHHPAPAAAALRRLRGAARVLRGTVRAQPLSALPRPPGAWTRARRTVGRARTGPTSAR